MDIRPITISVQQKLVFLWGKMYPNRALLPFAPLASGMVIYLRPQNSGKIWLVMSTFVHVSINSIVHVHRSKTWSAVREKAGRTKWIMVDVEHRRSQSWGYYSYSACFQFILTTEMYLLIRRFVLVGSPSGKHSLLVIVLNKRMHARISILCDIS